MFIRHDRQALALLQKAQPTTTPAELARVERPVLVISGDADLDNGSAAELARLLPPSTHRTVPGDHGSTMGSDAFAQAVVTFLTAPLQGVAQSPARRPLGYGSWRPGVRSAGGADARGHSG